MIVKTVLLVFVLFNVWSISNHCCYSLPVKTQKLDDTLVVDSVIREVRAIPPNAFNHAQNNKKSDAKDLVQAGTSDDPDNFEHHWSSGDDGDKGYIKNEEGKGSSGYKHFDSYSKKDGDKYDFEHHTSFGHGDKNEKEHNSKYSKDDNNEDVEKKDNKKGEGTHNSYQVSENVSEDDDYFEPYNAISGNYENENDDGESSDKSNYNNEQESADETDGNDESEAYTADDEEDDESSQFTDASEKDEESENLEEYDDYE